MSMIKKEEIIEYLDSVGVYEPTDEYLVDIFIDNIEMMELAKIDLRTDGLKINVAGPDKPPYYQPSPAISILNTAIKNILNISRKLALSPLDRAALKIQIAEEDGF